MPKTKRMTPAQVVEFFTILRAQNPEPKTELHYTNPYTLLVAVVLSAQATDKGVNKATAALFQQADSPQKMLTLGEARLKQHIKTIGLFNAKAKNIIALSQKLLADYGGQVPNRRADLESLPGVGRKTANVVLNCAFGMPTMAVDTHVFRLANRTGLAVGKNPLAVEQNLHKRIPAEFLHNAHHWLILHGRYVCKAQTPLCGNCPVYAVCGYGGKESYRLAVDVI
jgi:endonuclease III